MGRIPAVSRRAWRVALLVVGLVGVAGWAVTRTPTRRAAARAVRVATRPRPHPVTAESGARPGPEEPAVEVFSAEPSEISHVLLLGIDRTTSRATGRTDAMVVLSFRPEDGQIAAFNIPRDLWVDIPEHGPGRINKVVRLGDRHGGDGAGVGLLRRVIRAELGIAIDHVAAVDFAGFAAVVDELGGIEVDVQCPLVDCFWLDGPDSACRTIELRAGRHRLDGAMALAFVRSRHGRGDKDRRRRQHLVLLGFRRALKRAGATAIPALWRSATRYVWTDADLTAAAYYASFVLEADAGGDNLHGLVITTPLVQPHVTDDGKHVVRLDRTAFQRALATVFERPMPGRVAKPRCPVRDIGLRAPAR